MENEDIQKYISNEYLINVRTDSNDKFIINNPDYKLNSDKMLNCDIDIFKLKDHEYGLCGSTLFNIGNRIFLFGGFCAGSNANNYFSYYSNKLSNSKYEIKFFNHLSCYFIDENRWEKIGEIDEILPRSQHGFATYENNIYIFGGYSFEFMTKEYLDEYKNKYGKWPEKKGQNVLDDCFKITINDDNTYKITKLPNLLIKSYSFSCTTIKNILYFFGGACDVNEKIEIDYETKQNILSKHGLNILDEKINMGNILFSFDLTNPYNGFNIESIFAGVPRLNAFITNYNSYIYVFGGNNKNNNIAHSGRENNNMICAVSDCWRYHIQYKKWEFINEIPISGYANFSIINYNNYSLFLGGVKFFKNIRLKGEFINYDNCEFENSIDCDSKNYFNPFFKYGKITNTFSLCNETKFKDAKSFVNGSPFEYYQHYFSDVIIAYNYDENKFYICNKTLPINMCLGTNLIQIGNSYYYFASEINDILVNDIFYGIQTSLCLRIDVKSIVPELTNIFFTNDEVCLIIYGDSDSKEQLLENVKSYYYNDNIKKIIISTYSNFYSEELNNYGFVILNDKEQYGHDFIISDEFMDNSKKYKLDYKIEENLDSLNYEMIKTSVTALRGINEAKEKFPECNYYFTMRSDLKINNISYLINNWSKKHDCKIKIICKYVEENYKKNKITTYCLFGNKSNIENIYNFKNPVFCPYDSSPEKIIMKTFLERIGLSYYNDNESFNNLYFMDSNINMNWPRYNIYNW